MHAFLEWLGYWTGVTNESGPGYGFWSGIGSDFGEVTLVGAAVALYRKQACHVDHCWRLARHAHTQDGATYQLCRKHHPSAQTLSAEDVRPAATHVEDKSSE